MLIRTATRLADFGHPMPPAASRAGSRSNHEPMGAVCGVLVLRENMPFDGMSPDAERGIKQHDICLSFSVESAAVPDITALPSAAFGVTPPNHDIECLGEGQPQHRR